MKILFSSILVLPLATLCFGQNAGYLPSMNTPQLTSIADGGNILAQARLGSMYAEGRGVTQDYVQAYKWLTLSLTGAVDNKGPFQKSQATVELQKSITDKMTPEQIEEAERLAKEWEAEYEKKMGSGPYRAAWGVATPRDVYRPLPSYTDEARRARISGRVVVEFVVRKDGTVGDCRIVRGLGYGLDESAIQTMTSQWRFQPGTYRDKPVDVIAMAEVVFKLH
jgi:TonB family protein